MSENKKGLVVVSGASSGIGLAMANKLLMEGYSVLGLAKEFYSAEITHEEFSSIENQRFRSPDRPQQYH